MFRQHHGNGAAVLGESGLDHFDKEPVFFFAMVAFVGKVTEEPAEVRHILPDNRAAGRQRFSHGVQRGQHFNNQLVLLHH